MKVISAFLLLCTTTALLGQAPSIPDGPIVWVDQTHYHIIKDCPKLEGVPPKTMTLHQAILSLRTDCPTCKPLNRSDVNQYVSDYLHAISVEKAATAPFRKLKEGDAVGILKKVTDDLADPKYAEPVKDVERSSFRLIFQNEASKISRTFTGDPMDVAENKDLVVTLVGPATFFAIAASEQLRKLKPVTVKWIDAVGVLVMPRTIESPDIEQVILRSGGSTVAPIAGTLTPEVFSTMLGMKTTAHAGLVFFPSSAFADGATMVELMLIPKVGTNIVHLFTTDELRKIQ